MYRYREIICPFCRHQFVWLENSYRKSGFILYRRKGCDEHLESTFCPECSREMVVLKDCAVGADICDEAMEIADIVRGL